MFYSQYILAKRGPLGTIWIAAHLDRRLRKQQITETDIAEAVRESPIHRPSPEFFRLASQNSPPRSGGRLLPGPRGTRHEGVSTAWNPGKRANGPRAESDPIALRRPPRSTPASRAFTRHPLRETSARLRGLAFFFLAIWFSESFPTIPR